jgi:hypothetical protein
VQRTAQLPSALLPFHFASDRESVVPAHCDEGVQSGIVGIDLPQACSGKLNGRHCSPSNKVGGLL